jgi:hypothetical protein
VTPYAQEVAIGPNDLTKQIKVEIQNNTAYEGVFQISVVDFGTLDDTGGVLFAGTKGVQLNADYALSKWLQPEKSQITLAKGEKQNILVTVHNDQELKPGGHYAAIVLSGMAVTDGRQNNQVSLSESLSSLIFLRKTGGEVYNLHLDRIDANNALFKLPTKVTLRFKNDGNVHIVPRGIVSIKENSSVTLKKGVINTNSLMILPQTTRLIDVDLMQQTKPGLLPGFYSIQVDYRYDGYDTVATKIQRISYLYIPAYIFAISVLLVTAGVTYYYIRKKGIRMPQKLLRKK